MDQARDRFREAGAEIVCVFQYRAEPTRNFCRRRGVELECLGDPDRAGYAEVGLERASLRDYAGPGLAKRAVQAATAGHVVGNPEGGDVRQLPGTFVVARGGEVVLAHYNRDSADNPSTETLVEAARSAATG